MCVEQVKKKKNEKKNWPHEKKSKDKYHLFTSKNINNDERELFTEYLELYLNSLHEKTY